MAIPKREELMIPVLQAINELGGEAHTRDIYKKVATYFSELTQEDLEKRVVSGDKTWNNKLRWIKFLLAQDGQVTSSRRGIWQITDKGKVKLGGQA